MKHDDFNTALTAVLSQIVEEAVEAPDVDDPLVAGANIVEALTILFAVVPSDGVAHDVIGHHLDEIVEMVEGVPNEGYNSPRFASLRLTN